jgi:hypothetical protein
MRLLRAALLKLVRRPATWRAPLVLAALLGLIYLSIGISASASPEARASVESMLVFPEAYLSFASMLMLFLGIVGAAYAGTVAASEWSWNTIRVALARGESRVWYVTGLFVAIGLLTLVAWLALFVLGIGVILLAASLGGMSAGDLFDLADPAAVPLMIAAGGWAVVMLVGIGFGASFISRSAVAGVALVVGLVFVEQFAAMTSIPAELLSLAPLRAAASLVAASGGAGSAAIGPLVLTTIYLAFAIAVAAASARRAQVA